MKKLTDKQEKFSQLVVKYGNQSKAYREAYDVKEDTKDSSITENASRLMTDVNVASRVKELRKEQCENHGVDTGFIIRNLKEVIDDVNYTADLGKLLSGDVEEVKSFYRMKEITSNTDKLRATEQLSKMLGLNQPDKLDITVKDFKTNWGD